MQFVEEVPVAVVNPDGSVMVTYDLNGTQKPGEPGSAC